MVRCNRKRRIFNRPTVENEMVQQIKRFSVFQTAKVFGVLYAIAGLLVAPIFMLGAMFGLEESPFGLAFAFLLPAFYGVLGFVMTAIAAALYNFIAGWLGGVEVELSDAGI
jgi:hypothetical protein